MASSNQILEQLDDAREELKHEVRKEAYARRLLVLGVVLIAAATTLGPAHIITEALAVAGGVLGFMSTLGGASFVTYFMFATDWRVNHKDVNHQRFVSHLKRRVSNLENTYSEALQRETGQ